MHFSEKTPKWYFRPFRGERTLVVCCTHAQHDNGHGYLHLVVCKYLKIKSTASRPYAVRTQHDAVLITRTGLRMPGNMCKLVFMSMTMWRQ